MTPSKKMRRAWLILPMLLALAGGAWNQAQAQAARQPVVGQEGVIEVRVLPLAEVFGEVFTLGEISEMDGFDLDALARLANIEVGTAPLPGRELKLNANHLRSRLSGAGKGLRFRVIMPVEARVTRAAQLVPGDDISAAVLAQAAADTEVAEGAELRQKLALPVADVAVPKGELMIAARLLGKHMVEGGSRVYRVSITVNGKEAWKASLRVRQDIFQDVVVARRRIRRHQKITRADVTRVRKNISIHRGDPFLVKVTDVVGRFAKRPIGKTQPLHKSLIQTPADVPEGGRVTVIYESGGLVLRAPGVALIQGRTGQFIPVKNLQSGRVIHGILQAGEIVKVN